MRSEFDDIRAHITAEPSRPGDLLELAHALLDDLEQLRTREVILSSQYLALLTAARATMAADADGHPEPLTFLQQELTEHELAGYGLPEQVRPPDGEQAQQRLSDATTAQAVLAHLDEPGTPRRSRPLRGAPCGGVSRRLRG